MMDRNFLCLSNGIILKMCAGMGLEMGGKHREAKDPMIIKWYIAISLSFASDFCNQIYD